MNNSEQAHKQNNNVRKLIHDFDDINLSDIVFKKSLKVSDKSSNIPIYYNKTDMLIQSPKMNLPFGISTYQNRMFLNLSFSNYGNDEKVIEFLSFMNSISKLMRTKCNKIDKIKREFIDPLYKPNNYSHLLKLKMFHNDNKKGNNKPIIQTYDHNKNLIQLNDIEKNTYVKTIIIIPHIWYNNIKCGYDCYVLQIKAYLHIRMLGTYCFIDDDILPIATKHNESTDTNIDEIDPNKIKLKDHPSYKKYFKMLNYGVKIEQIQMQMKMENLDSSIITQDPMKLIDLNTINKNTNNDETNNANINDRKDDNNSNKVDLSSLLVGKSNLKKSTKIINKKKYKSHNMFYVRENDVLEQINKLRKTNIIKK